MKPKEIMGLISQRAAATNLNVKGFIGKSGISFTTFRRLQTSEGGNSMTSSIAACLRLMDLAEVANPEKYLELELPGEQVVAIRRADFLVLVDGAVAEVFEKEKNAATNNRTKAEGNKIENKQGEANAENAQSRKKALRKGRRAIPRTGRSYSRGRSNRSGRSRKKIVRWDLVPLENVGSNVA